MKTWAKVAAGVGAGLGAYLLFVPKALATEDKSGTDVDPNVAKPPAPAPTPAPAPGMPRAAAEPSIGRRAVEVLFRHEGAQEEPKGSNKGPLVDEIMRGVYNDAPKLVGKPWCARTLRWAYEKAAQELGMPKPFTGIKGALASVADWRDKFKAFHVKEPKVGAAGLIMHGGVQHATLVSRVDGGTVYTIEGNHKDGLHTVKRPKSKFDFFVDVESYIRQANAPRVAGLDLLGAEHV